MARAKRHFLPGHAWLLTHRCHKKEFLLKLVKDRQRWLYWLFQAKKRYGWIHSGDNEIQRPRQRYGIIDFKKLMALLQIANFADFKEAHREWIEEALKESKVVRESKWTIADAYVRVPTRSMIYKDVNFYLSQNSYRQAGVVLLILP